MTHSFHPTGGHSHYIYTMGDAVALLVVPRTSVTASCTSGAWCIHVGLFLPSCRSAISGSYNKHIDSLKKEFFKRLELVYGWDIFIFCSVLFLDISYFFFCKCLCVLIF